MINIDMIMDYEAGRLDARGTLELFADLIETGQAYRLQGTYGRTAHALIMAGLITDHGVITPEGHDVILEAEDLVEEVS